MPERRSRAACRASFASWLVSLALALGSCATAHEATMPDDDTPNSDAGGRSAAAGTSTMIRAGSNGAAAANTGGAANGGTSNSASGATGTTSAGAPSSGTAGSAGNHAGGLSGGTAGGAGGASAGGASAGTSAAGAVLFSDDFEDGAPNDWQASAGTWVVMTDGSKVYAQTGAGTGSSVLSSAPHSASAEAAWTDQIIEAKIKINAFGGSSTSYFAALYGRYDGSDYYALALRSDGKIAIRKNTSTLGSAVAAGIAPGTWYTVRLEIVGSTLKAYVNGTLEDSETDASLTAGGIALAAVNTTAEFDDVRVSEP